ncbi:MAG: hypothetical protein IKG19_03690 [Lachnospiraceae bacterium]|nr:hypothetical protein [Lachnospiraceae bacterium]
MYASLGRMNYAKYHVSKDNLFIRELVYTLYKCDLIKNLVDKNNDKYYLLTYHAKDVDIFKDEMLSAAVRSLVLADVTVLRKTVEEFMTGRAFAEWCEYDRLRNTKAIKKTAAEKARELQLKDEYAFLLYFAERAYDNMRKQRIDPGDGVSAEIPKCIVSALGIRTCPYCNRGFIGVTGGQLLGVQLDHFYNRRYFPFLAVSLYNLVPCCGVCNHIKKDDMTDIISPYENDANFDKAVHFTYEIPKASIKDPDGGKRRLSIEVSESDVTKRQRYQNNIDMFRLREAYEFQEIEAERFYEKMLAYPESRLREIENHFKENSDYSVTVSNLEEALFREYFADPSDYTQKPMAKFYRDLYYNIKGWKR